MGTENAAPLMISGTGLSLCMDLFSFLALRRKMKVTKTRAESGGEVLRHEKQHLELENPRGFSSDVVDVTLNRLGARVLGREPTSAYWPIDEMETIALGVTEHSGALSILLESNRAVVSQVEFDIRKLIEEFWASEWHMQVKDKRWRVNTRVGWRVWNVLRVLIEHIAIGELTEADFKEVE